MPLPSKEFVDIPDDRVDADSPTDAPIFEDIRDSLINLMERIGEPIGDVGLANHAHRGRNVDGTEAIGGTTGGISIAAGEWIGQTDHRAMNLCRFKPEFMMFAAASRRTLDIHIKHTGDDGTESTNLNNGFKSNAGISNLHLGGARVNNVSAFNVLGDAYAGLLLKSNDQGVQYGTYTGNGSARTISGLPFEPEAVLIWRATSNITSVPVMKTIGMAANDSKEFGGLNSPFSTNQITALNSDGFDLGTDNQVNSNNIEYAFLALRTFSNNGESIAVNTYVGDDVDDRLLFTNGIDATGFNPQWAWIICTDVTGSTRGAVIAAIEMNGSTNAPTGATTLDHIKTFEEGGVTIGNSNQVNDINDNYMVIFFESGIRP